MRHGSSAGNWGYNSNIHVDYTTVRLFEAKLNKMRVEADLERLISNKNKLELNIEKCACYEVSENKS